MNDADRDAALTIAEIQLKAAQDLAAATDRIIESARLALTLAAVRADVHAEALAELQAVQILHTASITRLQESQRHILETLQDRSEP